MEIKIWSIANIEEDEPECSYYGESLAEVLEQYWDSENADDRDDFNTFIDVHTYENDFLSNCIHHEEIPIQGA
jgi:hypothetical protein